MPVFENLKYWRDSSSRTAAENMAVDEILMRQVEKDPVLRVYDWAEPSVSFGYFHALKDARAAFPSSESSPVGYVRRWTGGGIVDHRNDLTYTLVVPRECELANQRGATSYRLIHQVLKNVLEALGQDAELRGKDAGAGAVCFESPVAYDLADRHGTKLAGAGQRRTRNGLLHQGSVMAGLSPDSFGQEFAQHLAVKYDSWMNGENFDDQVADLATKRYATAAWLSKK